MGGATNLRCEDIENPATFCTCEVTGKPETKFKTEVAVEGGLNPTWDHKHELPALRSGTSLSFSVFGSDTAGSEPLGQAELPSEMWFPGGFAGELQLTKSEEASLQVKVEILETKKVESRKSGASEVPTADA